MAKMRAVDAAMYVLEKKVSPPHLGFLERQLTRSIPQCVSTEASVTFWLVMLKALPIWRKAIRVRRQETLAFALALLVLQALI